MVTTIYLSGDTIEIPCGEGHGGNYHLLENVQLLLDTPLTPPDEPDPWSPALVVMPDGRVFYHYSATPELTFMFDLLSEVGQPWVPDFERIIAQNGLEIVCREVEESPWVFDCLAGTPAAQRGIPSPVGRS